MILRSPSTYKTQTDIWSDYCASEMNQKQSFWLIEVISKLARNLTQKQHFLPKATNYYRSTSGNTVESFSNLDDVEKLIVFLREDPRWKPFMDDRSERFSADDFIEMPLYTLIHASLDARRLFQDRIGGHFEDEELFKIVRDSMNWSEIQYIDFMYVLEGAPIGDIDAIKLIMQIIEASQTPEIQEYLIGKICDYGLHLSQEVGMYPNDFCTLCGYFFQLLECHENDRMMDMFPRFFLAYRQKLIRNESTLGHHDRSILRSIERIDLDQIAPEWVWSKRLMEVSCVE